VSTVSRILKDEKYIGGVVWNRTTTVKDPLSGRMKQVDRPKEEWVTQERQDIRIISDEEWNAAQAQWRQVERVFPSRKGKKGFRVSGRARSVHIPLICCLSRSSAARAAAPSRS
jgi:hypothetical protein